MVVPSAELTSLVISDVKPIIYSFKKTKQSNTTLLSNSSPRRVVGAHGTSGSAPTMCVGTWVQLWLDVAETANQLLISTSLLLHARVNTRKPVPVASRYAYSRVDRSILRAVYYGTSRWYLFPNNRDQFVSVRARVPVWPVLTGGELISPNILVLSTVILHTRFIVTTLIDHTMAYQMLIYTLSNVRSNFYWNPTRLYCNLRTVLKARWLWFRVQWRTWHAILLG